MDDFIVVKTHTDLILYVDALQKKNAEALSFYPKQVFEREAEKGRIFLGLLNGQPCGYLYAGSQGRDVKLHQVCIEYDARKRRYGEGIVSVMEDYAVGATSITLRCGFDLEANDFWKSLGYHCIQHQKGGIRRMRTINVWRKFLELELFTTPVIEPAIGKADASLWRKNKKKGENKSQFIRGTGLRKGLDDPRGNLMLTYAVSPAIKARYCKGPSSDGDGDGLPIIPVAFQSKASSTNSMNPSEVAPTLDKCKSDV